MRNSCLTATWVRSSRSSASIYADAQGRTLDEPGDATYSTKKVQIEQALLGNDRGPAAVVRPCAIYGRGDRMAREWHFVKRALDDRRYVLLANRGSLAADRRLQLR